MKPALLHSYIAMLPRVQAEDTLRLMDATGLGSGSFEKNAAQRMISNLRRIVNGGRRNSRKATTADLAARGIRVESN